MQKINWEPKGSRDSVNTQIGQIRLHCSRSFLASGDVRWYAYIYITSGVRFFREGPFRCSLQEAKEDAVRLARELLLDYQEGLDIEKANFDL
jgi:hypothetical protein